MKNIKKILFSVSALFFIVSANSNNSKYVWMPIWDGSDDQLLESKRFNTRYLYSRGEIITNLGTERNGKIFNRNIVSKDDSYSEGKYLTENTLNIYGDIRTYDLTPVKLYNNGKDKPGTEEYNKFPNDRTICPLKIRGNVILDAYKGNIKINIESPVVIEPEQIKEAPSTSHINQSVITFYTGYKKHILVDVKHNIIFRTLKSKKFIKEPVNDLFLYFIGNGKTIFQLSNGTKVSFYDTKNQTNNLIINEEQLISPINYREKTPNSFNQTSIIVTRIPNNLYFQKKLELD